MKGLERLCLCQSPILLSQNNVAADTTINPTQLNKKTMFAHRKKSDLQRFFNRQLISESPELISSDDENQPPIFSTPMQVDQVYTGHYPVRKVLLHLFLAFAPGLLLAFLPANSGLSSLSLTLWFFCIMFFMGRLIIRAFQHDEKEKQQLFHGETQVTLKTNGLKLNHIGQAAWEEILSIEPMNKYNQQVCLNILNLGKFQLKMSTESFKELAAPYFAENRRLARENSNSAEGALPFKGFFFNALLFYIVFLLGCLAGLSTFIFILINEKHSISNLSSNGLFSLMVALIFWISLGWRKNHLQATKTKLFELEGFALRSSDGKTISLRDAKITAHRKFAIPFKLTYLSIYPKAGGHLDLWIEPSELELVVNKLNKIGIEIKHPKQKASALTAP